VQNSAVLRTIWVDAWQLVCCGDDFEVGKQVVWDVLPTEGSPGTFLFNILGSELASKISGSEDHHEEVDDEDLEVIVAVVRRIQHVSCHFDLNPDSSAYVEVPGSAVLVELTSTRTGGSGKNEWDPAFHHVGYLVDLDELHSDRSDQHVRSTRG
jgi:hypothetical protein